MNVEIPELNYLAIAIGGVAYYALGALWYTVLFGNRWIAATGRTREQFPSSSPAWMGLTLVAAIVSAAVIAMAYAWAGGATVVDGILVGAILGVGIVAMELLKNVVYNFDDRNRPWALYAINGAYGIAGFVLAGAIYGLMA